MTPRERVWKSIEHEEPDRVPLAGSFRPEVVERLKQRFGTDDWDEVLDHLGIDWRGGIGMGPAAAFRERCEASGGGGSIRHPDGTFEDELGVIQSQPSKDSPYHRYVYHPLADEANLKTFEFPDPDDPTRWEGAEERVRKQKEKVLVLAGVGTFFRSAWHLRGFEQWLMDLASNHDFVNELLDRMQENDLRRIRKFCELGVDIISMGGDIALQRGLFMHPDTWRKVFKPRDAAIIEEARKYGVKHFYFHSDGNLWDVLEDLIEVGFDIFNPIQPECMDPYEVKARCGDRITLHGTVSSQHTLPFGSVEDVRREVEDRIHRLAPGGGLTIAPNNVVQYDVPIENILAVYETAQQLTYDAL